MNKKNIIFKLCLIVCAAIFVICDATCAKKSKALGNPADGWTPPEWVDNWGTPEPTEEPETASVSSSGGVGRAVDTTRIATSQYNVNYQYQSSTDKIVAYYHNSSTGADTSSYYPPNDIRGTTVLSGYNFTAGRILPNTGHTSATRSFQLDNEGYVLAIRDVPRLGEMEPKDKIIYSFHSDSAIIVYEGNFSQDTLDKWQEYGYYNLISELTVRFSVTYKIEPRLQDPEIERPEKNYSVTYSTTWGTFSTGYNLELTLPDWDFDNYKLSSIETVIAINPYGVGAELANPLIQYYMSQSMTWANRMPHYIFTDGGIWFSRNVESADHMTFSVWQRLFNWAFVPDAQMTEALFDEYLYDIDDNETSGFVITLRSRILDMIEGDYNPNIVIDFPECSIPINGTRYVIWERYHFDLMGEILAASPDAADQFRDVVAALHFATDTLITTAFINSIVGMIIALFDLKIWQGVNGDDITE